MMKNEMYCPACGNDTLQKFPNNSRLVDFLCTECGEVYELKSKGSPPGRTILDGAYFAALERINSNTNPNLFVLHYDNNIVENITLIPKHFFTPDTLIKNRALSPTARRAGYIGSLIRYCHIPEQGKIAVIKSRIALKKDAVMRNYTLSTKLKVRNLHLRGWLMDIMQCIDKIANEFFSLSEIYAFAYELKMKHPDNNNAEAKIREQLQFLRDRGFIEFLGNGNYRKILYT